MKISTRSKKRGLELIVPLSLILGCVGIVCLTYFCYVESKNLDEATALIETERLQSSYKLADLEAKLSDLERTLGVKSATSQSSRACGR